MKIITVLSIVSLFITHAQSWNGILIDGLNGTQLFTPAERHSTVANLNYNLPHKFASVGVFYNGQAYFIGGKNDSDYSADVLVFNPETMTTSSAPSMLCERAQHSGTVFNDRILICGGQNDTARMSVCEVYSSMHHNWSIVTPLPAVNMEFSMATLHDRPYSFGGYRGGVNCGASRAVYTLHENKWVQRASLPNPTRSHATIALDYGRVLLCGGWSLKDDKCQMTADCFVYEAEEDIWISAPPMAIARQMHSMVMLNGVIYIMGGEEVDGGRTIEMYNTGGVMMHARMTRDISMAAVAVAKKCWY